MRMRWVSGEGWVFQDEQRYNHTSVGRTVPIWRTFLILNSSGIIESINHKAANILNLDEEIGKPLPMDELSRSRWHSFLKRVQQEKYSFTSLNIKGKDSRYKEIKVFGMLIKRRIWFSWKYWTKLLIASFNWMGEVFWTICHAASYFSKEIQSLKSIRKRLNY